MLDGAPFDKPFAKGVLGLRADFVGTGETPDALIGSLAGQGGATLAEARLPGLDPNGMTRVVQKSDAEQLPMNADAVTRALAAETGLGERSVRRLDVPLRLAGGVLHLGPVPLDDPVAEVSTTAALDLRTMTLDMASDIGLRVAPRDWAWPDGPGSR